MRFITTTPSLRLALSGLVFGAVFVPLEVLLFQRISRGTAGIYLGALVGWLLVGLSVALSVLGAVWSGRFWIVKMTKKAFWVWVVSVFFLAATMRSPLLGFFGLFVILYFVPVLTLMSYELSRPYYGPGIAWYEGKPRPIPGLRFENLEVSRIDRGGFFAFSAHSANQDPNTKRCGSEAEGNLTFRDLTLRCRAIPVVEHTESVYNGVGLAFDRMSSDERKRLGDFIERVRSEGYGT